MKKTVLLGALLYIILDFLIWYLPHGDGAVGITLNEVFKALLNIYPFAYLGYVIAETRN